MGKLVLSGIHQQMLSVKPVQFIRMMSGNTLGDKLRIFIARLEECKTSSYD